MDTVTGSDGTPKYPHLESLERARVVLEAPRVWITEKIDGFNARCGRTPDGTFWIGTRNRVIDADTEPCQGFTAYAKTLAAGIPNGCTVYGEWAGRGIQKRIDYGAPAFWMFDLGHLEDLASPEGISSYAANNDIRLVPVLYDGPPPEREFLDTLRRAPGIAGSLREGIVIRPWPIPLDREHRVIAKYRNPAFAETASQRADRPPRDLTGAQAFVDEYVTAERLRHVFGQLTEVGIDPCDVRSTGDLLRAMYNDVVREGAADFAALTDEDRKSVGSVCARTTKAILPAFLEEWAA